MPHNISVMVDPSKPEALQAAHTLFSTAKPNIDDSTTHVIALGGDGFMLSCLQTAMNQPFALYGVNYGTRGFLMNPPPQPDAWPALLDDVTEAVLHPLHITMIDERGHSETFYAFNELAMIRASGQALKVAIRVDGIVRLDPLMGDGLILSTPAGSSAYNYAAQGPMLPLEANVLPLTPMNAHNPRRWPGALLSHTSHFRFDVLEPHKRPAQVSVDGRNFDHIVSIEAHLSRSHAARVLFNNSFTLHERLIQHQFDL